MSDELVEAVAKAYDDHRSRSGGWTNFPEPGFDVTCMCGEKWSDPTCPYVRGELHSERADAINAQHDLHRARAALAAVVAHLEANWGAMVDAGGRAVWRAELFCSPAGAALQPNDVDWQRYPDALRREWRDEAEVALRAAFTTVGLPIGETKT